jgi:hypothetical protein
MCDDDEMMWSLPQQHITSPGSHRERIAIIISFLSNLKWIDYGAYYFIMKPKKIANANNLGNRYAIL